MCKRGSRDIDGEGCGEDTEAMPSIQPYGSLPGGLGGKVSGHLGRLRRIPGADMRRICVAADSPITMRHPLELVPDTFSARSDTNGALASVCVARSSSTKHMRTCTLVETLAYMRYPAKPWTRAVPTRPSCRRCF
jgi:hypothetical protein